VAHINQELFERISKKLGVGRQQTYRLIAKKAAQTHLPRHLAALSLAAELGINISKKAYASDEDRAQLRSVPLMQSANPPVPVSVEIPPPPGRTLRRQRTKKMKQARKSNTVHVVHGRNLKLRDAMFEFLRAIGLNPIEWSKGVKSTKRGAPYNNQVLDEMFRQAAAVVVILSPDDEARLKREFWVDSDPDYERQLTGQPRPNVLFEAGRAFGSHPESTILTQVGRLRPFSDTQGMNIINLSNLPECRRDLANRLEAAGCAVDDSGTIWLSAGDFSYPPQRRRK